MRLRPQRKWRGGEIRSALKARERRGINFKKTTRQKKQINKHKKKQKKEKKKHGLQGPFANYQHLHLLIRSNEHFLNSLFSPNMNISFSLTCNMRVDSFQWSHSLFFPKCAPACVYVNIKCKTVHCTVRVFRQIIDQGFRSQLCSCSYAFNFSYKSLRDQNRVGSYRQSAWGWGADPSAKFRQMVCL